MGDEAKIWDRQDGEPLLWYRRFERFRLMEPVHSIPDAYADEHPAPNDVKQRQKVPGDWYEKAREWNWEGRVAAWDAFQDAQIEKQIAAERRKVLNNEFALMHRRVQLLNRKVKQLADITDDEDKIWLDDVKSIGSGEFAERVDLKVFNSDAFKELREYLDDMAAEMGERVKTTKQEHSGKVDVGGVAIYLPQKGDMPALPAKQEDEEAQEGR